MIRTLLAKAIATYNRLDGVPAKTEVTRWAIDRVSPRYSQLPTVVSLSPNGFIELNVMDPINRAFLTDPKHAGETWLELSRYVDREEVYWDIGTGNGCHAMRAVWDPGVVEVHCFEERAEYFKQVQRSARHNQGRLLLHPFIPFAADSIDEILRKRLAPVPTLLRISAPEKELEVLQGAQSLFETSPPKAFIFETPSDAAGVIRGKELREFLERYRYWWERLEPRDRAAGGLETYIAFRLRS